MVGGSTPPIGTICSFRKIITKSSKKFCFSIIFSIIHDVGRETFIPVYATIAQLVERRSCKPQVIGSIPIGGSIYFLGRYQSGQMGWTVNPLACLRGFESLSAHQKNILKSPLWRFFCTLFNIINPLLD